MKILTFSTLYPSATRPTHGIFVETRLRKLVETGSVQARVMAPCPWFPPSSAKFGEYSVFARMPTTETRFGIQVDHPRYPLVPKIGMSWAPLAMFASTLPKLRRQIQSGGDFELIDAHYFYPDGIAAVLLGRALRRPVVVTARGTDLNLIATYMIPRRWIRWAAKEAAALVAVSNGLKQRLVCLGVDDRRVHMLRNGVDLTIFRPHDREAARAALQLQHPTLLAVGNLIPLKRHSLLIEALERLHDFELLIVGEGPEQARLLAQAGNLGVIGRVRFLGRLPQTALPMIYSAADILVHPSVREGWPNVLLESMACGTPVIASNFEGASDIVSTPEAGRILSEATPACLANAVRQLLAASPHPAATRRYAEGFGWESTTAGQLKLFNEICASRAI